jgi:hypothetical protein
MSALRVMVPVVAAHARPAAESMAAAAAELRRQEWFDLEDDAEPEAVAAWNGALEGLKSVAGTFEWVADGWI